MRVLFVSLTNDGGSSRIVAACGRLGAQCAVLGPPGGYAAASRAVSRVFALPARFGALSVQMSLRPQLEAILRDWRPERLVPLDEMGAHLLRRLHRHPRASAALRHLLESSLGAPGHFETALGRGALMQAAQACGVLAPGFRIVSSWASALAGAGALGYPLLLKREYTCGGAGVAIIASRGQLRAAYLRAAAKAAAKRLLLRLSGDAAPPDPPLMLQAFVPGALAMRMVACERGRVLDGIDFLCERQHPEGTGASTVIRPAEHAQMATSAQALVARLGCSGFVAFDYILASDGRAHLIEMNARPIGSGHLGARFGHDLHAAWLGVALAPQAAAPPHSIALFPKEIERDSLSPALQPGSGVLHDAPFDDPAVLALHLKALLARRPAQAAAIRALLGRDAGLAPALALPAAVAR